MARALMEYEIFDITVRADCELPFRSARENDTPDVEVVEDERLVDAVDDDQLGVAGERRYDFFYGGWVCSCRTQEGELAYTHHPIGELDLPLWHVLERMALPIWLGIADDDYLIVHGSSVRTDAGGWLVVGETESGKSTTAYELMRDRGAKLASDEMAVLDVGQGRLHAGSPALRLHPETGAEGQAVDSGPIHPALGKRWYRFPENSIAAGRFSLTGICVLTQVASGEGGEADGEPQGIPLEGGERLTTVLDQTFEFEDSPHSWRERRFRNAARLVKSVPVYEFRYRRSEDGSPAHVEALWEFMRECEES